MSWHRLTLVGIEHPRDIVVGRTRALQACELFGEFPLHRARFSSGVSILCRRLLAAGGGRVSLEASADPPAVRACLMATEPWSAPLDEVRELLEITKTPRGLCAAIELPCAPLAPEALLSAGAHLARLKPGMRAQASLVSENQALHSALDELDDESQRAARLAARLQLKTHDLELFASATSHDLREPLVVVKLYSQLLLRHLEAGDNDAVRACVDTMQTSVEHALRMLEGLAAYGRLAETPESDAIADVEDVVSKVREALASRLEEAGAQVIVEHPLPTVRMRPEHLAQVFQNLITNSLKFCDRAPVVSVRGSLQPGGARLLVEDNGIGIAPGDLKRIFKFFGRAHPERPGTGVGLALVARIVQAAGGRIEVSSTEGEGTTFTLVLPPA